MNDDFRALKSRLLSPVPSVSTVRNVIKKSAEHGTFKNLPGREGGREQLMSEVFQVLCEWWK